MEGEKMGAKARWAIEALPFIWGAQNTPNNADGVPNELPFVLSFDEATGRVIQEQSSVVAACLSNVYEKGSILGSNVDDVGAGRLYADDFLKFISEWVKNTPKVSRQSVLEIGCGNGYMLDRLRGSFASVAGIEPGPQGQSGAERYELEIIKDFFPSPQLHGLKFSAILLMSVLEHVEDPVALASMLANYLQPGGRVFVSVPDEGPYIRNFDVSTLFHEHWSYFDRDTLLNTMALGGLTAERCEASGFGGSVYGEFSVSAENKPLSDQQLVPAIEAAIRYMTGARASCDHLLEFCQRVLADNRTLGVYVPARFVNAMRIAGIPIHGVRFFDDDPSLVGTFYPGIPIAIESRASLIEAPVDTLLIMSRTFGSTLKRVLTDILPDGSQIVLISDLGDLPSQGAMID